jgi:N-acetyl-gamma-glutamyl-phosphate reductase
MINVGIIGGAGYTAGELLRVLVHHPETKIQFVHSTSNAGKFVYDVHHDLIGETSLKFTDVDYNSIDVLFLCMGHGDAKVFLAENKIPGKVKIIDLSQDFRIKAENNPFVYGLPELNRDEIKKSSHIANPGCFATSIELALLPLASAKLLTDEVHVNGITGSTGAGQAPSATTHFTWRNDNVSVYKPFQHQHLKEINQSIKQLQSSFAKKINFIPIRGDFARGIFTTAYTSCNLSLEEAKDLYRKYYEPHPFVNVVDENPDVKYVLNTNKSVLYLEKHDDQLFIISIIDNLLKGASGQAVQNMNLIMGLDERTGLNLKSIGY